MSADWDGLLAVWVEAAFVLVYVSLAAGAVAAGAAGVVRTALVAPLLAFLPGYALLAALFPGGERDDVAATSVVALAWTERCALAVALSLLLLSLLVAADVSPMDAGPVAALSATALAAYAVGVGRRLRRPPARRYAPPFRRWTRAVRARGAAVAGTLTDRGG